MNEMSDEQSHILDVIRTNVNVIVDAIAGSGKSTTILSIAKALPEKSIVQLTYNSMLRYEIKDKAKTLNINNIKIHTFHSLAVKYYLASAHTDTGIRHILMKQMGPRAKIPEFHLLVLDESQDMTYLYFQFMVKFSKDMGQPFQLLILGDYKQGLYEFKGADTRFLTISDKLWELHPQLLVKDFVRCTLKMSYRITRPMASFVNNVMLGEERMFSCRDGEPVRYYRQSRKNTERFVIWQILQLIEAGAKPCEFFVLGASVKGPNSDIRKMENALVENNIPCHVPMIESENIDEKVIDGKIVFSTFHAVKGRQRPYVFIVGFDNSYYYYSKYASRTSCPNTLYVGATRASNSLFLLERNEFVNDRPLDFFKMNHKQMKESNYIDFKGIPQIQFWEKVVSAEEKENIPRHNVTPSTLIKFVPESVIEDITPLLDAIFVKKTEDNLAEIEIPNVIQTRRGFYEDISDINGVAIPCIYFHHIQKRWKMENSDKNMLLKMIQNQMGDTKDYEYKYLKTIIENLPENCEKISHYLYMSNVYIATQERLYFRLKQIEEDEYNWLKRESMIQCIKRIDSHIVGECKRKIPIFEQVLIDYSMDEEHVLIDEVLRPYFGNEKQFRFSARLDLVTEDTIWELKCTTKITIDHLLQVVIYAWLWRILVNDGRNVRILNIKTGEVLELVASMEQLTEIMIALLKGKYCEPIVKTDEEFVEDCRKLFM